MTKNTVTPRFELRSLADQRAAFNKKPRAARSDRKRSSYTTLWTGTDHDLAAIIDANKDSSVLTVITVRAVQNDDTKRVGIELHRKVKVDTAGKYLEDARSRTLTPDELSAGINLVGAFALKVGTPENDPLGFYAATGLDTPVLG